MTTPNSPSTFGDQLPTIVNSTTFDPCSLPTEMRYEMGEEFLNDAASYQTPPPMLSSSENPPLLIAKSSPINVSVSAFGAVNSDIMIPDHLSNDSGDDSEAITTLLPRFIAVRVEKTPSVDQLSLPSLEQVTSKNTTTLSNASILKNAPEIPCSDQSREEMGNDSLPEGAPQQKKAPLSNNYNLKLSTDRPNSIGAFAA